MYESEKDLIYKVDLMNSHHARGREETPIVYMGIINQLTNALEAKVKELEAIKEK